MPNYASQTGKPRPRLNDVPAGEYAFVRGHVTYSHISHLMEGEELERDIERAKKAGRYPQERPHTRISVCDAAITDARGNLKPEDAYTPFDQYIQGSFYTSHNANYPGWNYRAQNTSNRVPEVAILDPAKDEMEVIYLAEGEEPARGSDVILVLQCYAPSREGYNKGVALREVVCVQGFQVQTSGIDAIMQSFGITVTRPPRPADTPATAPAQAQAPAQPSSPTITQVPTNPQPTANNSGTYQSAPGAPYGYTPTPQVPQQPQMPVQPQPTYPQQPSPYGADPATQPPVYGSGIGLNAPFDDDEGF